MPTFARPTGRLACYTPDRIPARSIRHDPARRRRSLAGTVGRRITPNGEAVGVHTCASGESSETRRVPLCSRFGAQADALYSRVFQNGPPIPLELFRGASEPWSVSERTRCDLEWRIISNKAQPVFHAGKYRKKLECHARLRRHSISAVPTQEQLGFTFRYTNKFETRLAKASLHSRLDLN